MPVFVIRNDICVMNTPRISLFVYFNIERYSLFRKAGKSFAGGFHTACFNLDRILTGTAVRRHGFVGFSTRLVVSGFS